MSSDADVFWADLADEYRRTKGLTALTADEVEETLAAVVPEPLTDEQIDRIAVVVLNDEVGCEQPPRGYIDGCDVAGVQEDVLQVNRNRGKSNPAIDARIDELRRRALDDGKDSGGDQAGVAG